MTATEATTRPGPGTAAPGAQGSAAVSDIFARLAGRLGAPFVVAVVAVIARLWTSRDRRIYGIWPDEPAQLGIARTLGSGVRWNMYNHSTWRPGYGTLLAPVYWFTDDPTTVLHAGLVLNALLGGCAAVLLYVLARRLTSLGAATAAGVALLVSLAPALVFTTNYVWSEALVQPLYLATVLVLLHLHDRPSIGLGLLAGALAIAAFATHSRMLPLAGVVGAVVAVAVWRHRLAWWRGAAVVAGTGMLFIAASWYSEWIVDRLWEQPFERNSYGGVMGQLGKVDDMFVSIVGQTWSQLVVSCGMAGLGAVAIVRASFGRALRPAGRAETPLPSAADARIVLGAAGVLVALSMLFMTDRWRSDQIVYSRYNDAAVATLVLVGIAALVTVRLSSVLRVLAAVAATTLASGIVLNLLRHDELAAKDAVRQMILGLLAFMGRPKGIDVLPITIAALAVSAFLAGSVALARLARLRGAVLMSVTALVLVGYLRADDIVNRNRNGWSVVRTVAAVEGTLVPEGATVEYLMKPGSNDTGRMMAYQFYLPDTLFEVVTELELDDPATPFLFAPTDNPVLPSVGAIAVWEDPGKPITLWVLPGAEQDRIRTDYAGVVVEPPGNPLLR